MLSEIFSSIKKLIWPTPKPLNSTIKTINIKIITSKCGILIFEVKQNEIVIYLKKIIMDAIGESSDEILMLMKLTRMRTWKEVSDFDYLDNLDIKSNEEFLLSFSRSESVIDDHLFLPGPSNKEIHSKTAHLKAINVPPIADINYLLRHDDLKKLYITLARECAYIIGIHSYSNKLIMFYRQKIHNYMKNIDCAFKVMCQLGFSPKNVTKALLLNSNNYKLALDWLIDNIKYKDVNTSPRSSKSPRSSFTSNRHDSILSSKYNPATSTITDRINGLLEIVSFYSEKEEPVYMNHLEELVYMGFEIDLAREALRVTNNNLGASCAYLLGEEHPSIFELRHGLSYTSPISKSLLKTSTVQELLSFPESFVYFLTFIDKRVFDWSTFEHNNGELMQYIIDFYHEEKHSLAVNQFNNSLIPISALSVKTT